MSPSGWFESARSKPDEDIGLHLARGSLGTKRTTHLPWNDAARTSDSLHEAGLPVVREAVDFLDGHGVSYRLKDVTSDPAAFAEMEKESGQTKAPTLDWHGKILADFGTDELVPFLREQDVKLEDS